MHINIAQPWCVALLLGIHALICSRLVNQFFGCVSTIFPLVLKCSKVLIHGSCHLELTAPFVYKVCASLSILVDQQDLRCTAQVVLAKFQFCSPGGKPPVSVTDSVTSHHIDLRSEPFIQ